MRMLAWGTLFAVSIVCAGPALVWNVPPQPPEYPFSSAIEAANFVTTICKTLLIYQGDCSDAPGLAYFTGNLLSGATVRGHVLQSVAFYATPVDSPTNASPGIPRVLLPNRKFPPGKPIRTIIYSPNMVNTLLAYRVDVLYRSILGWPQADQMAINYWVKALRDGVVSIDHMIGVLCAEGYGPRAGCSAVASSGALL